MVRAEHQDLSPSMSGQVRALKAEIDQGIRRLLREGVRDGSIRPLRREDDGLRAGRRAELDRALVSRAALDERRADRRCLRQPFRGRPAAARRRAASPPRALPRAARSLNGAPRSSPCPIKTSSSFPPGARPSAPSRACSLPATAPQLGAAAARAAIESAGHQAVGYPGSDLRLRAARRPRPGAGAPGRASARACPSPCPPPRINKMCGSGLKAVMMAADQIRSRRRRDRARGRPRIHDATRRTCCRRRAAATAWAMAKCSTTCSTTACRARSTASSWAASPMPRRAKYELLARGAGCVRHRVRAARAARRRGRRVRGGDRAGDREGAARARRSSPGTKRPSPATSARSPASSPPSARTAR